MVSNHMIFGCPPRCGKSMNLCDMCQYYTYVPREWEDVIICCEKGHSLSLLRKVLKCPDFHPRKCFKSGDSL